MHNSNILMCCTRSEKSLPDARFNRHVHVLTFGPLGASRNTLCPQMTPLSYILIPHRSSTHLPTSLPLDIGIMSLARKRRPERGEPSALPSAIARSYSEDEKVCPSTPSQPNPLAPPLLSSPPL